ncbi:MAG: shikimate kinase, partial [Myxococcales bacterium]
MGSGKSTVAGVVADLLGTQALDLDAHVEALVGTSIPAIFAERGERAFRVLEREAVKTLPPEVGVVSLGGGTLVDEETRQRLLREGIVITLTADPAVLAARVGAGEGRPLLGEDPRADLERILAQRADAYAEAHAVIDTSTLDPEEIAAQIVAVRNLAPIVVPLGERTYRVEVGRGSRHRVGLHATRHAQGEAVLVFDGDADRPWAADVIRCLALASKPPIEVKLPGDEAHKDIQSVERIWDAALDAEVDRRA